MCHINLAVLMLLGAGATVELQVSVPPSVRSGDAVPVRERLVNSGASDAELIAVGNVSRRIANLDSGEVFATRYSVVPFPLQQAPKVAEVVRRGATSRVTTGQDRDHFHRNHQGPGDHRPPELS